MGAQLDRYTPLPIHPSGEDERLSNRFDAISVAWWIGGWSIAACRLGFICGSVDDPNARVHGKLKDEDKREF